MTLERLWSGWRSEYVASAANEDESDEGGAPGRSEDACVFCRMLSSGATDEETYVVWRGERTFAVLNAFPYTSGHLLVMPTRHVGELEALDAGETAELWPAVTDAVRALKAAYSPEGLNVGINLGRAAGAGIPGHFHVHVMPRWNGDTNFMTTAAETRVLPEALPTTWEKVRKAWPGQRRNGDE